MKRVIRGISFYGSLIDDATIEQIIQLSKESWVQGANIAIMPDAHVGKGTSIGTSIALDRKAISPNVVGVDIGCGVLVSILENITSMDVLDNIEAFEKEMRKAIPTGYNINKEPRVRFNLDNLVTPLEAPQKEYMERSLCTLGGGNHFIEVGEYKGKVAVVVHTGSRNLGVQVHRYHQELADTLANKVAIEYKEETQRLIEEYKATSRHREINSMLAERNANIPSTELRDAEAALIDDRYDDYINDMKIAQRFAKVNREVILRSVILCMRSATGKDAYIGDILDSPHNYIDIDHSVIRKGAVSAQRGERVVIPLGPAAGTIIGTGKGLAEANCSAPHGAGRAMSRSEARKVLTVEDMSEAMGTVYSGSISQDTIDEAPQVYKDAETILNEIENLVEVEGIIAPYYSFKDVK